jgi:hypothetical protein
MLHVDFERAAELISYLEKDLAALDRAVDNYWQNFPRFKVKFLSLFHSADEAAQPNPDNPLNKAAEKLDLSQLIQLRDLIADEERTHTLLHRLGQNNDRMRTAASLLGAYIKHFQNSATSNETLFEC